MKNEIKSLKKKNKNKILSLIQKSVKGKVDSQKLKDIEEALKIQELGSSLLSEKIRDRRRILWSTVIVSLLFISAGLVLLPVFWKTDLVIDAEVTSITMTLKESQQLFSTIAVDKVQIHNVEAVRFPLALSLDADFRNLLSQQSSDEIDTLTINSIDKPLSLFADDTVFAAGSIITLRREGKPSNYMYSMTSDGDNKIALTLQGENLINSKKAGLANIDLNDDAIQITVLVDSKLEFRFSPFFYEDNSLSESNEEEIVLDRVESQINIENLLFESDYPTRSGEITRKKRSTILGGTVKVLREHENVNLLDGDHLRLIDSEGVLLRLFMKKDNLNALFRGKAKCASVGSIDNESRNSRTCQYARGGNDSYVLTPTLAEWLQNNPLLILFWTTMIFLVGLTDRITGLISKE